jgi:hypothetical protein
VLLHEKIGGNNRLLSYGKWVLLIRGISGDHIDNNLTKPMQCASIWPTLRGSGRRHSAIVRFFKIRAFSMIGPRGAADLSTRSTPRLAVLPGRRGPR